MNGRTKSWHGRTCKVSEVKVSEKTAVLCNSRKSVYLFSFGKERRMDKMVYNYVTLCILS